ncbi:MAG: hypothetical protein KC615_23410, partial [Anaerolineae bacterium]|nr:hypothetical protein [Anaerolineae bacterium]
MATMISCLLIQDFAAAVERINDPSLQKEPLLIVTSSKRPKVLAMSELPRRLLIKPGMTMRQSQIICPIARVVTANEGAYQRAFEVLLQQLLHFTDRLQPEYQPTSAAVYLATDTERQQLLDFVTERLGIGPTLGVSEKLFTARVAAAFAMFGGPTKVVESGHEAEFLAKYPVDTLPLTKDMRRRLPLLGIRTIGQLAALPHIAFWEQFGKKQLWIHELAQGIDHRTIQTYVPPVILSRKHTFDDSINDYQVIQYVLQQMVSWLIEQLAGREAGEITLLLQLENKARIELHTKPHLPVKDSPFLMRQLEAQLYKQAVTDQIVEVEVQLSHIQQPKPRQLSLFGENASVTRLEDHLPSMQYRHPNTYFQRAILIEAGPYAPPEEQFELERVGA